MVLLIYFLVLFRCFWKNFGSFSTFSKWNSENNVGSFEFLRCVAPAAEQKIRKSQHCFLDFILKNVDKRTKIFSKTSKKKQKINQENHVIFRFSNDKKKKMKARNSCSPILACFYSNFLFFYVKEHCNFCVL